MIEKRCFCVIYTEIVTTTRVYLVDVEQSRSYPTLEDLAITATLASEPVAVDTQRTVKFMVMQREEKQ